MKIAAILGISLLAGASQVCLAQDMYGPVFDQTFPVDRSMTTSDNKLFKMTEYTNKFYGYYFYQLDPTGNKLHVRVRTTNDRSRPPHPHMIACGIIKFMSRGQPVVTAYHLYPANNTRRTYIDDTRAIDLAAPVLASIDQVNLRSGWCNGVPDRKVEFRIG